ncbi:hypothetical protein Pta02_13580 [Planobispora takensis]|uniref:Uncharacterized protein n=1 Tax=Planobispora takensis TaxID=1367882 RepID=A0A8J3WR35_9ACTN|nr:hypothetical protein Pta02_13580 [Planobispora takensis]
MRDLRLGALDPHLGGLGCGDALQLRGQVLAFGHQVGARLLLVGQAPLATQLRVRRDGGDLFGERVNGRGSGDDLLLQLSIRQQPVRALQASNTLEVVLVDGAPRPSRSQQLAAAQRAARQAARGDAVAGAAAARAALATASPRARAQMQPQRISPADRPATPRGWCPARI